MAREGQLNELYLFQWDTHMLENFRLESQWRNLDNRLNCRWSHPDCAKLPSRKQPDAKQGAGFAMESVPSPSPSANFGWFKESLNPVPRQAFLLVGNNVPRREG